MPSLSPGEEEATSFAHLLPGRPAAGLYSVTSFSFRWKRYVVYISGRQLNILLSPTEQVQALRFDEELVAVRAEKGDNGKIAIASARWVWVLQPKTSAWNRVTWAIDLLLKREDAGDCARTLSWGEQGELLVGGTRHLSLFGTLPSSRTSSPSSPTGAEPSIEDRSTLWSMSVASPVRRAEFSPSASLIATSGDHDRLVKIWRRLSFEEGVFDFAYLPHDGPVTHLEWRVPDPPRLQDDVPDDHPTYSYHGPDEECEVFFTLAADAKLRIWRTSGHNDLEILSLYTTIDLVSAIPHSPILNMDRHPDSQRPARFAFMLPSASYCAAISTALRKQRPGQVNHSIEHLKEVSAKHPDVLVSLDAQGRMSAWGLSSIGHKRREDTSPDAAKSPFHIAHAEGLDLGIRGDYPASFDTWFDGDTLNILVHSFGHTLSWWRGNIETFSSPSALTSERGELIAEWSGSSDDITGVHTAHDRRNLLSWSRTSAIDEWSIGQFGTLKHSKTVEIDEGVLDADNVQRDKSLFLFGQERVVLSRVIDQNGSNSIAHGLPKGSNARLLRLEDADITADASYLLYNNRGDFCVACVNQTRRDWQSTEPTVNVLTQVKSLAILSDTNGYQSNLVDVYAAIHPRKAGWLRLTGLSKDGTVHRRDVSISTLHDTSSQANETALVFPTPIEEPSIFGANCDCAALVSSSEPPELVVVDLKEGYVEHQQNLSSRPKQLRFTQNAVESALLTEHGILAVVFEDAVEILARSRYGHTNAGGSHKWALVKRLTIAGIGPSISSVDWLNQGRLALAAGNTVFISDNSVAAKNLGLEDRQRLDISSDDFTTVSDLASDLRTPVAIWHARFLRGLVLHGQFTSVVEVLKRLEEKLRFYTQGDPLDPVLNLDIRDLFGVRPSMMSFSDNEDFSNLEDQLSEVDLPLTSDVEQERLKVVVGTVSYVLRHLQSLDTNAVRYLFDWRYHVLLHEASHQDKPDKPQSNGYSIGRGAIISQDRHVPIMHWREITFAYHSSTQQPLLEILNSHFENKLDWNTVRSLGITSWLHNIKAAQSEGSALASLEQVFDVLGQNAYRSSQPPNPAGASLFLLALRKKATLLALWRVAIGNPEQKNTQNFLKRNFDAQENKTAARKNAYALMGKRRFEYAAAFFVLANEPESAISILAGQCDDLQLAVAVARAYCGDESPVFHKFLQDRVMPTARRTGDRWLLNWTLELLGRRAEAARALVGDIQGLVEDPSEKPIRTWQQDDPAALRLYHELRDAPPRHASGKPSEAFVSARDEYRAVLRSARILRRMGLWLIALDLVSAWKFGQVDEEPAASPEDHRNGQERAATSPNGAPDGISANIPSMLDGFGSPAPSKRPSGEADNATSSLLDEFRPQAEQPKSSPASEAQDRAAKAAEMLAKIRAKKESSKDSGTDASNGEKKAPTQFKEPASSSILDSFGF